MDLFEFSKSMRETISDVRKLTHKYSFFLILKFLRQYIMDIMLDWIDMFKNLNIK